MMPCAVILNEVKNLEVSVAVVDSASLEILRFTQDDIDRPRDDTILCHSERSEESRGLRGGGR